MVNVVSSFAGCGGSSLGYKLAGCKVLLALDWEEMATKTYEMNHPGTIVWQKNIRQVTGDMILDAIGLKKGQLDIFDGSPPCTPFSTSGKGSEGWHKSYKHAGDSQEQRSDDLFFEYIRLIGEIMPKAFVGENVRGLILGEAKGYFNLILKAMKKLGYDVQVFSVNAKDFEVPQSRPRIIFLGVRSDIAKKGLKPHLKTMREITFLQATKGVINTPADLEWAKIDPLTKTGQLVKVAKPGESVAKYHPQGSYFNTRRAHHDKPIPTVTTKRQIAHPFEMRWLTIPELKRCASFPDDFKFLSNGDAWVRIGNSVPPNLMKNIALYIQKLIS